MIFSEELLEILDKDKNIEIIYDDLDVARYGASYVTSKTYMPEEREKLKEEFCDDGCLGFEIEEISIEENYFVISLR